ncbi:MAG: glycosyltransferase family 2 protein [Acidobacteria bacterium]|nr:glycosyltransferase family 2 protein [Acidobacteriota bacterium]
MPRFSLIVATMGRTTEMATLLASLEKQTCSDFELIVVDQNGDDRLVPVIGQSALGVKMVHLRCRKGASRARNMGMAQARGEIIAFPDDDCWYPPGLLSDVSEWFRGHTTYEILSVGSRDEDGHVSANGWFQDSCDFNLLNIYRTSACATFFIRNGGAAGTSRFDEAIGPGADSKNLGGEDTDFILSALSKGARGRYEAKWNIGHPRKDIRHAGISKDRAFIYGKGMGFVQRKHGLGWLWAAFIAYDYGRAAVFYALGKRAQAGLWLQHGRGLVDGFRAPINTDVMRG